MPVTTNISHSVPHFCNAESQTHHGEFACPFAGIAAFICQLLSELSKLGRKQYLASCACSLAYVSQRDIAKTIAKAIGPEENLRPFFLCSRLDTSASPDLGFIGGRGDG